MVGGPEREECTNDDGSGAGYESVWVEATNRGRDGNVSQTTQGWRTAHDELVPLIPRGTGG